MDETYPTYLNRVARLTRSTTHRSQLQNIQESPKFKGKQPEPFPGFSIVTPPCQEDSKNSEFYDSLKSFQQQLINRLDEQLIVPVPPESFHLTVADLIWDSAYRDAVAENPKFENRLKDCIQTSFEQYQGYFPKESSFWWQILGLMLRPRAIAVCLIPKNEEFYRRILELRRSIYQNSELIALGIEQQYLFTAHITLGYFGKIPTDLDREKIAEALAKLNEQWIEKEPPIFAINQVQLRKFDDMTRFYREEDFPVIEF